jgi:hypothetical protein
MEKQLKDLSKQEVKNGMEYVNNFVKYGKTASEIYNLYNSPLAKAIKEKILKKE